MRYYMPLLVALDGKLAAPSVQRSVRAIVALNARKADVPTLERLEQLLA